MNVSYLTHNRVLWIILIVLISLGIVGVAVAAINYQVNPAANTPGISHQGQGGMQPAQSSATSPTVEAYLPKDATSEEMRLQAAASAKLTPSLDKAGLLRFKADSQAKVAQAALTPSRAGINYIPEGIVVDTYLYSVYGRTNPYAHITVTRLADGAYGAAEADDVGTFWTWLYDGSGAGTPVGIAEGDELLIDIDGSESSFTVGAVPQGTLNVSQDGYLGNIPGDTGGTAVNMTMGMYGAQSTAYGFYGSVTDQDGDFGIPLPYDVGPENFAIIDYMISGVTQRTYFFPEDAFAIEQHRMIVGYAQWGNNVHAIVYVGDSGDIRWEGDAWATYPYGWFTFDLSGIMWDVGDRVVVQFPGGGESETHYVYSSFFTFSGDDTVSGDTSSPDTLVRVSYLGWDGSGEAYHETRVWTDANGQFTAVFGEGGIRPDTSVDIAIADTAGNGTYMVSGQPYVETIIYPESGLNCVWGRVDTPNTALTLELIRGQDVYPRDPSRPISSDAGNMSAGFNLCFALWYDINDDGNLEQMPFQVGDILRLSTPTWTGEVTIQQLHWAADAVGNLIDGSIVSGPTDGEIALRLSQPYNSEFFPPYTEVEARGLLSGGNFDLPVDDYDVRGGTQVFLLYYDPLTGFANQVYEQNHFFRTLDDIAVWGRTYIPNEMITLRLLDPDTLEAVYSSTNDTDQDPYSFYFDFADYPIYPPLEPGIIVEVSYEFSGTGDQRLTYQPIGVVGDETTSMVTAYGPDMMLDLFGGYDQTSFDYMAPAHNGQAVMDTTHFGYPLGWGDSVDMVFPNQVGNRQVATSMLGEIRRFEFWFNPNNWVNIWGTAEPGHQVTIQTSRGDTLTAMPDARCDGCFETDHAVYLLPGDIVTATAGAGLYPVVVQVPDFWVDSDSNNDLVSGYIGLPDWTVEIYPWWGENMTTTLTDGDGYFSQSFMDVPPQGRGYIRYTQEMGSAYADVVLHRPFYDIQPSMSVNYAHNWVEGQYDSGYAVAITVTNELGELRATAHGVTGPISWWGGDTGFSTNENVQWDGGTPDIQVWDRVYLNLNGYLVELQLGEISGEFNYATDVLTATFNIPWLSEPVWGDCGVWEENGPGMGFAYPVNPNGGSYTCDFGAMGWDLIPGQNVGVSYSEPNSNRVYNVFVDPTPHLWINLEQLGQPAFDNNFALRIHYNNDGWATTPDLTIVEQLFGMTYLSDSTGVTPSIDGNTITWNLGELPYNHTGDSWFDVFVHVDDPNSISSILDISTSLEYYQWDTWSRHYEWSTEVWENGTDLNIGTWPWTGDPAPGQDFVYVANVCNNGSTASTEVIITDTLPLSTTLVSWWAQDTGWELASTEPNLVFTRPTVNAGRCSEVDINVHLSEQAWPGMQLHNQAWVWSSSDLTLDNNYSETWNGVNIPYYNLHIGSGWFGGQFVPNGEIDMQFWIGNWGNTLMPGTIVTTTLPAGTEFLYAYTWDWVGNKPFSPSIVNDQYLVWDIGDFANGYWINIGVRLKVAGDVEPGTSMVFENRVAGDALEVRYDDNSLVFIQMVYGPGVNLRVDTHSNWWWDMWDNSARALQYEVRIYNVGTQYQEGLTLTDTYPVSTTLNWCWGYGHFTGCQDDPINHTVMFYYDALNPGESTGARFSVSLAYDDGGVQGLEFVNQADISNFDDIYPADNHDEITSYTGFDDFARKWLKEGDLRAGELVTYTVEFGNLNRWPWNWDWPYGTHITDTLPVGMTFVKAIPYWDPDSTWDPESINGQQITWSSGAIGAENSGTFDLVVRIDENVPLGTELLNTIDIQGDGPIFEINPENNHFEYVLYTNLFRLLMPITIKTP